MKALLIFLLILPFHTRSQTKTFKEEEFTRAVIQFHPVAKQAGIDIRIAKADILSARGNFDPLLRIENAGKEFGGITYYDQRNIEVKIPTWYGIDVFAGRENIKGSRLNPEETQGLVTYVGFSVQPIQNLLMDKRRAALLQAKNYHSLTETQRRIILNDLLKEAMHAYWNWWEKYQMKQIIADALANAEKRMRFVKTSFELGERPAIDTLEAFTQVQAFQIRLIQADAELSKALLEVITYLWTENNQPFDLPSEVVPVQSTQSGGVFLQDLLNLLEMHPELSQYEFIMNGLRIDRKLAFQSLLPDLKLLYNQTGNNVSGTINSAWFNNNYRYGIHLSMPLRLSEGRGTYQKTKLKMENARLEMANNRMKIETRVKQNFIEWQQMELQTETLIKIVTNTAALQRGEETRFANGESSLFMINTREQKTIEMNQKLIELRSKTQKALIDLRWAAGVLFS